MAIVWSASVYLWLLISSTVERGRGGGGGGGGQAWLGLFIYTKRHTGNLKLHVGRGSHNFLVFVIDRTILSDHFVVYMV